MMSPVRSLLLVVLGLLLSLSVCGCVIAPATTTNPSVIEGTKLTQQGDYDAAIAKYSQGIRENPRDSVAYFFRAQAYNYKKDFDNALADMNQAIALHPDGLSYNNRGTCYYAKGLTDQALADYDEALKLGFSNSTIYLNRGMALKDKARYTEALRDFDQALEMDPTAKIIFAYQGDSLFALGQYQKAAQDYEQYLASYPKDEIHIALQGLAYYKLGQMDMARVDAGKVAELDPRLAAVFSGDRLLGVFDLEKRREVVKNSLAAELRAEAAGRWSEAFEASERAFSHMMGYTKEDQAAQQKIVESFLRVYPKLAVKPALPESARRFEVQAQSYVDNKEFTKAIEAYGFEEALVFWYPDAHFNRALVLGEQKQYSPAIYEMNTYLKLFPGAPDARADQDKIYEWESKIGR
jgi:tetratricopeptide (TPR) repeat protein